MAGPACLELNLEQILVGLILDGHDITHVVGVWTGVRVISDVTGSPIGLLKLEVVVGPLEDGVTDVAAAGFATTADVLSAEGLELDELEVDGVGVVPMAEVASVEGVGIGELELDEAVAWKLSSDDIEFGLFESGGCNPAFNDANQSGILPTLVPDKSGWAGRRISSRGIIAPEAVAITAANAAKGNEPLIPVLESQRQPGGAEEMRKEKDGVKESRPQMPLVERARRDSRTTGMGACQTLYTWNAVGVRLLGRGLAVCDRHPLRNPGFRNVLRAVARAMKFDFCSMAMCFNIACAGYFSCSCVCCCIKMECSFGLCLVLVLPDWVIGVCKHDFSNFFLSPPNQLQKKAIMENGSSEGEIALYTSNMARKRVRGMKSPMRTSYSRAAMDIR